MKASHFGSFLLAALLAAGCGGGGGGGNPGTPRTSTAYFAVQWPSGARFIHNKADLVRMRVYRSGAVIGTTSVEKPAAGGTSQLTLAELPADEPLEFRVSAEIKGSEPKVVLSSTVVTKTLNPGG